MKFELQNANKFGWEGVEGWGFNTKKDFSNASAAYFEVTGSHGKVKNTKSDRIYLVVEGVGEFDIDGNVIPVRQTDVVIVPKNTLYDYRSTSGVLKLFLVHTPAFEAEFDEK